LCCDRCPASFHLLCHTPPINARKIPVGKWLCNRCTTESVTTRNDGKRKTEANVGSDISIDDGNGSLTESERNERTARAIFLSPSAHSDPLSVLAEAALAVNAEQFSLEPVILADNVPLPGDELSAPKSQPSQPSFCHLCSRSTAESAAILCDFCPLVFHLDCIDPPFAAPPKEKWMCPNHVEHTLDRRFVKSLRLSNRIKLWNAHARQPINELNVKLSFIDKGKRAFIDKDKLSFIDKGKRETKKKIDRRKKKEHFCAGTKPRVIQDKMERTTSMRIGECRRLQTLVASQFAHEKRRKGG